MDLPQRNKLKYIALGGACAAVVVSLAVLRRRAATKKAISEETECSSKEQTKKALERPSPASRAPPKRQYGPPPAKARAAPTRPAAKSASSVVAVPFENFEDLGTWATGLKKRDSAELPRLLASTEKLLREQPEHKASLSCLKALVQMVGGNQEADRVSAVAVQAGAHQPELALEVLNALFKDRRQRGGFVADPAVVDFALDTLRNSIKGGVQRGTYQRACRLVDWLSLDSENRAELASRGGFETLLQVMETFHEDPGVLLEGCGTLHSIAAEPSLDAERAVQVAIGVLQNFAENPELQWRGLAALHGLPLPSTELRLPVAKLACEAAKRHPRCDTVTTVVEWSAKLLHKLAKDRTSDVRAWLRHPDQKPWLEAFKAAPLHCRGKVNREAEHWVNELCRVGAV